MSDKKTAGDLIAMLDSRAICRSGPYYLDIEHGKPTVWKRVRMKHTEPHETDWWDAYRVGSLRDLSTRQQGRQARTAELELAQAWDEHCQWEEANNGRQ